MAEAKKEVVEVEATSTAIALAAMYEDDAGGGFEQADKDAYAIPFLSILQSGSPQVKKSDGAYIAGAEEGSMYNSVTQAVINGDEGVEVVPCYYQRRFIRWGARDAGGGFKGEYAPNDPILAEAKNIDGHLLFPDAAGGFNEKTSDILMDTRNHYVLILQADGSFTSALLSLSSSQVKKSRQWMSKMEGLKSKRADGSLFTPPMFSHKYKLTTVPESNDQGSWYGWKIETGSTIDAGLYQAGKAFRDAISAGEVKTQQPGSTHAADSEVDSPF